MSPYPLFQIKLDFLLQYNQVSMCLHVNHCCNVVGISLMYLSIDSQLIFAEHRIIDKGGFSN